MRYSNSPPSTILGSSTSVGRGLSSEFGVAKEQRRCHYLRRGGVRIAQADGDTSVLVPRIERAHVEGLEGECTKSSVNLRVQAYSGSMAVDLEDTEAKRGSARQGKRGLRKAQDLNGVRRHADFGLTSDGRVREEEHTYINAIIQTTYTSSKSSVREPEKGGARQVHLLRQVCMTRTGRQHL
jgi:hypothetical protein